MEMQAQGIEGTPATDLLVDLLGDIVVDVKKAMADGKFDWNDAQFFMPLIGKIPAVGAKIKEIPGELQDLNSEEGIALLSKVAAKVGQVDDSEKLKKIIEGVVQVCLGGYKIFEGIKA